jgi:hypothetical protein
VNVVFPTQAEADLFSYKARVKRGMSDKPVPEGFSAVAERERLKKELGLSDEEFNEAIDLYPTIIRDEIMGLEEGSTHVLAEEPPDAAPPPAISESAVMDLLKKTKGGETRAVAGLDPRLMNVLGGNLYTGDLGAIATKEMVQNAIDAVRPQGSKGTVSINVNTVDREITVSDSGPGMTPKVATEQFVDIGGSLKEAPGSTGGFGIAKVAIFSNSEAIDVTTVRKVGQKTMETKLTGSGEDWLDAKKGLLVKSSEVSGDTPTGTSITVRIKPDAEFTSYNVTSWLGDLQRYSNLDSEVVVSTDGQPMRFPKIPLEDVSHVSVPGAEINIQASPRTIMRASGRYHVLSNGLPQFQQWYSAPHEMALPESIVVDVTSTSTPDTPDYPFRPDRQGLRGEALEAVDRYIKQDLVTAAARAEATRIASFYDRAEEFPASEGAKGLRILDTTDSLSEDFIAGIRGSDTMRLLTEGVKKVYNPLLESFYRLHPQSGVVDFAGVALGPEYMGIHVFTETLFPGENRPEDIYFNPFTLWETAQELVRRGASDDVQQAFAEQIVATLVHELPHTVASGHEQTYAGELTRFLGHASSKIAAAVEKMRLDVVKNALASGKARETGVVVNTGYRSPRTPAPEHLGEFPSGTEGTGLYVAHDATVAKWFTGGGLAEAEAETFSYLEPRNPLIVREEPLYILEESPEIMEPINTWDSTWTKLNKQAAVNSKTTDENWGANQQDLQDELAELAKEAGYDAIRITSGGETWDVLLDESLYKGVEAEGEWEQHVEDYKNATRDIRGENVIRRAIAGSQQRGPSERGRGPRDLKSDARARLGLERGVSTGRPGVPEGARGQQAFALSRAREPGGYTPPKPGKLSIKSGREAVPFNTEVITKPRTSSWVAPNGMSLTSEPGGDHTTLLFNDFEGYPEGMLKDDVIVADATDQGYMRIGTFGGDVGIEVRREFLHEHQDRIRSLIDRASEDVPVYLDVVTEEGWVQPKHSHKITDWKEGERLLNEELAQSASHPSPDRGRLTNAADAARARLQSKRGQRGAAGFGPRKPGDRDPGFWDDFRDLITVGADLVDRGFRGFAGWSKEMAKQVGKVSKDLLKQIWKAATKRARRRQADVTEAAKIRLGGSGRRKLLKQDKLREQDIADLMRVGRVIMDQGHTGYEAWEGRVRKFVPGVRKGSLRPYYDRLRKGEQPKEDVGDKFSRLVREAKELLPGRAEDVAALHSRQAARVAEAFEQFEGEEVSVAVREALSEERKPPVFEAVRDQLTPSEVAELYDRIRTTEVYHPKAVYARVHATFGLDKLLDGELPFPSEIKRLQEIFGSGVVSAIQGQTPGRKAVWRQIVDVANFRRALLASTDISASLRQSVIYLVRHPKVWGQAFVNQLKALATEEAAEDANLALMQWPEYSLGQRHNLYQAPLGKGGSLSEKEEDFISEWADRLGLPAVGKFRGIKPIRASNRAFMTMLNHLRMGVWRDRLKVLGPEATEEELKATASSINHGSGRGSLGKAENLGAELAMAFWSPRYLVSIPQVINDMANPGIPWRVRKENIKDFTAWVVSTLSMLAMLQTANVATVEFNAKSADFGKARIGNLRVDPFRGFQQLVRYLVQFASGERKTAAGNIVEVSPEDVAMTALRTKLAPGPSLYWDFKTGSDIVGRPVNWEPEVLQQVAYRGLTPIAVQDIIESYQQLNGPLAAAASVLSFMGAGVLVYPPPASLDTQLESQQVGEGTAESIQLQ